MISKKLLSAVLGEKISVVKKPYRDIKQYVYYDCVDKTEKSINTHELAHKCKEWALGGGHIFNVQMSDDITLVYIGSIGKDIGAPSEPEAIFKACEWIMEHKQ